MIAYVYGQLAESAEALNVTVAAAAAFLVHSTALILAGLALSFVLWKRGSAIRSVVLRATVAAVLLSPFVAAGLQAAGVSVAVFQVPRAALRAAPHADESPPRAVGLHDPAGPRDDAEALAVLDGPPTAAREFSDSPHGSLAREPGGAPTQALAQNGPAGPRQHTVAAPGPHDSPLLWVYGLIVGAWGAGTVFLLARLAVWHARVAAMRRRARRADPALTGRCAALAQSLGVRRPEVVVSAEARSPFLTGLLRPAIVLPAAEWSRSRAAAEQVLVHELAHLKRNDCLWNLAGQALCACAFWQPLAWRLARRAEDAADDVCDDYAVRTVAGATEYAAQLTDLAEHFLPTLTEAGAGVGVIRFRSSLGRRVGRLLDERRQATLAAGLLAVLTVIAFVASATFGVGALTFAGHPGGQTVALEAEPTAAGGPAVPLLNEVRDAARDGDAGKLKELLDKHPDLMATEGTMLLVTAAGQGHTDVVRLLVDKGASVNANYATGGVTPLSIAARRGHKDTIQFLVAAGAAVNTMDPEVAPPLYNVALRGSMDVAELLLDAGAEMDPEKTGGWAPLYAAARAGSRDLVELMLARGAAVNWRNRGGDTALHAAATNGNVAIAELLKAGKADVNARNSAQRTPLHEAALNGHAKLAEFLLAGGAAVKAEDAEGRTALHDAAAGGHKDVVGLLLAAGAAADAADAEGSTPLMAAAAGGHPDVMDLLVEAGADVDSADNKGRTAVEAASDKGRVSSLDFLLTHGATGAADPLLQRAVVARDMPAAERALRAGAGVNARDKEGRTPLFLATGNFGSNTLSSRPPASKRQMIEFLLANGADVNARDEDGRTALMYGASTRNAAVTAMLLRAGSDVNAKADDGKCALHEAGDSVEVIRELLKGGADANERTGRGLTPLHLALRWRSGEQAAIVRLLLEHGADPNAATPEGRTPLDMAITAERVLGPPTLEVAELLIARGAKRDVFSYAAGGDVPGLKALLDKDATLANAKTQDDMTPLHVAAMYGQAAAAEELIRRGAQVNAAGEYLKTPLHAAADSGSKAVIEVLVANGADVNARDKGLWTPLHVAARSESLAAVKALIAAGADVNAREKTGLTPLGYVRWSWGPDSDPEKMRRIIERAEEIKRVLHDAGARG